MGRQHVDLYSRHDPNTILLVSSAPAVLAVVGEHRTDPTRLLLRGEDGRHYTYDHDINDPVAVELTADWIVDIAHAA